MMKGNQRGRLIDQKQFPIYRGTDSADVDDGSTGELEGVYSGMLILISRFLKLPKTRNTQKDGL